MSSDIIIRRATAEDYDAVINITPDLWDGNDYLPSLYHVFLQTKEHVFYVAETPNDSRVVGFTGARISPDGRTVLLMSARTLQEFRGTGINVNMHKQLINDFPAISAAVLDGVLDDASKKTFNLARSFYQWNFLVYYIPADKMSEFTSTSSPNVRSLSVSESVELVKTGVCERFLRRFAVEYVPSASGNWSPVQLVEDELVEFMKKSSRVMVTFADGSQGINGISFSELMLLKTKTRDGHVEMQVQFFGDHLDDLEEHTRGQLSESVAATGGRNVSFAIHFPIGMDKSAAAAADRLSRNAMRGLKEFDAKSAYLASLFSQE